MIAAPPLANRTAASALIAVYWVIALLGIGVFTSAHMLFSELENQAIRGQAFRAEQLAEMGLAIAANPAVLPDDPILIQEINELEGFTASIQREASRINLNAVLANGQLDVLESLFVIWGVPSEEAAPLIDALTDWVDEDGEPTHFGAEAESYAKLGVAGLPPNRQFRSLEEIRSVRGADLLEKANPEWKDAFTLWGPGILDLTNASADVIAAVCRCSLSSAESFVQFRQGPDGLENTEDDAVLESADQAWQLLDTPAEFTAEALQRVTLNSEPIRLQSIGRSGDFSVERVLIVENRDTDIRILDFQSRRIN